MAITLQGEEPREMTETVTSDGKIVRTYTRTFKLKSTVVKESPLSIVNATGVTAFDGHPNDFTATCRSRKAKQHDKIWWTATCEYSTETLDRDESEDENPLAKPVKRSIFTNKQTRVVTKDINGDPILNKAKVAFDPPIEVPASNFVARFVRNEPSFSMSRAAQFTDHVNSVAFCGLEAGTVKCNEITATEEFSKSQRYWEVTYEFEYQEAGWQASVLNQGLQKLDGGNLVRILDENDEPIPEPVPLDNNGAVIAPASLPGAAVYLDFDVMPEADFNALGLNPY